MATLTEKETDLINIGVKIKQLKHQIKEKESELAKLEQEVKDYMTSEGKDKVILGDGAFVATISEVNRTNFDTNSFKKDHLDLYEQYSCVKHTKKFELK